MSLRHQIFQQYIKKLEDDKTIPDTIVAQVSELLTNSVGLTEERLIEILEESIND